MRVLLVGSPSARARLRGQLIGAGIQVAAEFSSAAVARASAVPADAVVAATEPDNLEEVGDVLRADELHEPLTPREVDVIELLAQGLPNKAIADRLGISDQTVKFHVASIYGKLGAVNRTDAVRRAARRGLIAL